MADTNVIAYLLIEGERTSLARRVWERDPEWRMPPLWRSEFLNVLATAVRARVLAEEQAFQAWAHGSNLFGRSEVEPGGEAVLRTALRYRISAYDAQFVTVADELSIRLVTTDGPVRTACPGVAISMEQFAAQS